jgi:uncharacterized membrane protein
MFTGSRTRIRPGRQLLLVGALLLATLLCIALDMLRWAHSSVNFSWMHWNLFLAWLPMLCALAAYNLYREQSRLSWLLAAGCAFVWLLFFPNAPYIVTDILHLQDRGDVPLWFDVLLFVSFAWTGVFLGLASLVLMQSLVRRAAGPLVGWVFAFGALVLGGVGIYVGRFLRWNSWDVLYRPTGMLATTVDALIHPWDHVHAVVFSTTFSLFLICAYLFLIAVTRVQVEAEMSGSHVS